MLSAVRSLLRWQGFDMGQALHCRIEEVTSCVYYKGCIRYYSPYDREPVPKLGRTAARFTEKLGAVKALL